jgi:hypothetical protein
MMNLTDQLVGTMTTLVVVGGCMGVEVDSCWLLLSMCGYKWAVAAADFGVTMYSAAVLGVENCRRTG